MRRVLIQRSFFGVVPEVLCFETSDVTDLSQNSIGLVSGSPFIPSPLRTLADAIFLGVTFPGVLVMNHIHHYSNILAACLFLSEEDSFSSKALNFVSILDRMDRFGSVGALSVYKEVDVLLHDLHQMLPEESQLNHMSDDSLGKILGAGIDLIHTYLHEPVPDLMIHFETSQWAIGTITDIKEIDFYLKKYRYGACFLNNSLILFRRSPFVDISLEGLGKMFGVYQKLDSFLIITPSMDRDRVLSICNHYFEGADHE
jgi:hypothetical protein